MIYLIDYYIFLIPSYTLKVKYLPQWITTPILPINSDICKL